MKPLPESPDKRIFAFLVLTVSIAVIISVSAGFYVAAVKADCITDELVFALAGETGKAGASAVAGIIRDGASAESIDEGKKLLSVYGYGKASDSPWFRMRSFKNALVLTAFLAGINILFILFLEVRIARKRLSLKYAEASGSLCRIMDGKTERLACGDNDGDWTVLINRINAMAERLELLYQEKDDEKQAVKAAISDISHQLKTPLASLLMINEIMSDDEEMPCDKKREFLTSSYSQLRRMEWLIRSLLQIARLESGTIIFNKEAEDPARIAGNALERLVPESGDRRLILENQCGPGDILICDGGWTEEALVNIIRNAVQHTAVTGTVRICVCRTPIFIRFTVEDDGCGIPEKDLPFIFRRFYSGSSAAGIGNVGIGLSLSKMIIEKQKGTISVTSSPGSTRFCITFMTSE